MVVVAGGAAFPTGLFCKPLPWFQASRGSVRSQDLKMMCADNEQTRRCWTSAFRLFKVFRNQPGHKRWLMSS